MNPMMLFDILARSRAGRALTPGERAFVKQVQGVVISILVTAATAAFPYLSGQNIDWSSVLHVFLASISTSIAFALTKYFTAQGDAPPQTAPVAAPAPIAAPAPVSGGEWLPEHFPTNPMLKNVPLPRAQRSAANVKH